MIRIFVSYHSADQTLARALAGALQDTDTEVFFAPWALRPGAFWQPELSTAINEADAFVMLLGTQSPGPWQLLEYYAALDRRAVTPSFALIPVLLSGEAPRLPFLSSLHIVKLLDPNSEQSIKTLRAAIEGGAPDHVEAPWQLENPYRGLHALRAADAEFFFGREAIARDVLERIRAKERCIWLVGNSGVGKSSIVEAGVFAALRRQQFAGDAAEAWPSDLADSRSWLYLTMTPSEDPLYNLARAFVSQWTEPLDPKRGELAASWAESLHSKQGLRGLLQTAREAFEQLHGTAPARFVLAIDQGEELYTRSSANARARFSEVLVDGLQDPLLQVIASLRSDHYGLLQSDTALFPHATRVDVPPLGESALRLVIGEPARKLGASFSDGAMVDMIAASAARQPGALPLLSYLMEDMWKAMQSRGDGVLRWSEHAELIGVHRVLARRARDFLETCNGEQREALKRLFTLKLAHVPFEGEVVRRRAGKHECSELEWALVEALCGERWRLLTTSEEAGEPHAEVAHEVLLHEWDELRGWLDEEHDFLRWKGQLEHERRIWEETEQDPDGLLQGIKLAQAESWSGAREQDLADADRRFIAESAASRDRKQTHRQLRKRRTRALVFGVMFAASFGAFATFSWNQAEQQRQLAEEARLQADEARVLAEQARQEMAKQTERATRACVLAETSVRRTQGALRRIDSQLRKHSAQPLFGILNAPLAAQMRALQREMSKVRLDCPNLKALKKAAG